MLISIVLLILVIILALVFKLYIFKFQFFRDKILEGQINITGETTIAGGADTVPFDNKIAELEDIIDKLVEEIEKYTKDKTESQKEEQTYKEQIKIYEAQIETVAASYKKLMDENREYMLNGEKYTKTQSTFLKLASYMRSETDARISKINAETSRKELIKNIINSFDYRHNGGLVNITVDNTHVYFYITRPGIVVFICRSNRKSEYILLGGGGAGGGNHGGGGGAGVIVGGIYEFKEGKPYVMYVGEGGIVGNRRQGAKNIYGYRQCGQFSFIAGNGNDILAPGGLYGGGGINGAALNRDNKEVPFPGGSGGGGMAYNHPANVRMDTRPGILTRHRIGSAYRGGHGKIISFMGNAGNGGGGGGAAGDGGNADDKRAGNGGSGIAGQYIPNWLPQCNKFMNNEWNYATNNGTIIAGGGGGGAWSQFLCVPGKGGRGGGGNGGGCVYHKGMRGLPRNYNTRGIPSTIGKRCPLPHPFYNERRHLNNIVGFDGQRGVPNTGSGGGGGSSTGFVGGDGGSGLLVIRVRIE